MPFYYIEKNPNTKTGLPFSMGVVSENNNGNMDSFYHHQHDVIEILYMIDGKMQVLVDDNEYHIKKGDAIIVNPFKIHYGKCLTNSVKYYCFNCGINQIFPFSSPTIDECKNDIMHCRSGFFEYLEANGKDAKYIGSVLDDIYSIYKTKNIGDECTSISKMYMLMAYLFENCYRVWGQQSVSRDVEFIKAVSVYVNDNFAENISTSDVAKSLFMNTSRFCHLFLKNFGMSFLNYLCYFRIIRASEMYFNKGMSLYDIAYKVGFSDYNYFSKMFKKYMGVTPSKYYGKTK